MKRQFLGDSKDSFKWDYHDYLTSALGYPTLNVMLMLTPDDNSTKGETQPELFPAREVVIDFCRDLRKDRNIQLIKNLPSITGSTYSVELHKGDTCLTNRNRREYFAGISGEKKQVIFLDPDNGFEPEQKNKKEHVLYKDVSSILDQISDEAVISVFQHFRRIPFNKDFIRIKERMHSGHAAAMCWDHHIMFVAISRSLDTINKVKAVNRQYPQYLQGHPVVFLNK
jgi:hypothetical protein